MNEKEVCPVNYNSYQEGLAKHQKRISGDYEHLIAVLGVTGAGKSTFISRATGHKVKIGHNLQSCTSEVAVYPVQIKGRRVALIDTPGFDDTHRTDTEVLEEVAKYLAELLAQGILLSGVILLQPVGGTRVQGSERKRTRLFEKICGQNAFPNVVIASTMWSKVKRSDKKQVTASIEERSTSADFWGYMLNHGARYTEHQDTKSSALKIISMILQNEPKPLQLQTELYANDGRTAYMTADKYVVDCMDDALVKLFGTVSRLKLQLSMPGANKAQIQAELQEAEEEIDEVALAKNKIQKSRVSFTKTAAWLNVGTGALAVTVAVATPFLCTIM